MSESEMKAVVDRIDFKAFPVPLKNRAIGMYFGKVSHGITTNFFSDLYFSYHLDDEGEPVFSVRQAANAIRYSMASEVIVAVQYLSGHGWFDEAVDFYTEGLNPFEEVKVSGWAEVWNASAIVDFAYYLEDVYSEIELNGNSFSKEWYYAKISHLYFLDGHIPDVAMTIGILLGQIWAKDAVEEIALRGDANRNSLLKASMVRKQNSTEKTQARNTIISDLWYECLREHGAELMRRDSNAAQAIHILVSERRPTELMHKSTGVMLGVEAIRKRLTSLRKLGKIG